MDCVLYATNFIGSVRVLSGTSISVMTEFYMHQILSTTSFIWTDRVLFSNIIIWQERVSFGTRFIWNEFHLD